MVQIDGVWCVVCVTCAVVCCVWCAVVGGVPDLFPASAGVDWVWHDHARTPHGFALAPDICTEYTEAADRRSTQAMWAVLDEVWPDARRTRLGLNACGTPVDSHWSIASAL